MDIEQFKKLTSDIQELNQKMDLVLQSVKHLAPKPKKKPRQKSSIYKGVSWDKRTDKWRAQIYIKGRIDSLGYFDHEKQAAKAYDSAAVRAGMPPGKLNFDYRDKAVKDAKSIHDVFDSIK